MPRRRDIDRLQSEIEELFSDLWQVPRYGGLRAGFRPLVDCYRTDGPPTLTVVVELAGIDPDDLQLDLGERELRVSGERRRAPGPDRLYQQMEIEHGRFERHVPLSEPVDVDAAAASYEAGLLKIVLPISERHVVSERVTIVIQRSVS